MIYLSSILFTQFNICIIFLHSQFLCKWTWSYDQKTVFFQKANGMIRIKFRTHDCNHSNSKSAWVKGNMRTLIEGCCKNVNNVLLAFSGVAWPNILGEGGLLRWENQHPLEEYGWQPSDAAHGGYNKLGVLLHSF